MPGLSHVPRVSFAGAAVAIAGLSSLVFAVLAIALLGHRAPLHQDGASAAVPAGAQRLVSALAILRRPQTTADRSLAADAVAQGAGPLIPSLTRLAVNRPGVKVFVVVNEPGVDGEAVWPARLGDEVSVIAQVDHRTYRSFPVPYGALRDPRTGSNAGGFIVGLVPDRVAKVRWSFPVKAGSYRLFGHVMNNIALEHLGSAAPQAVAPTDWFAADGHLMSTSAAYQPTGVVPQLLNPSVKARMIKLAEQYPSQPSAKVRATFPVFAHEPWSGSGVSVTHPAPSALPAIVLLQADQSAPRGLSFPKKYVLATLQVTHQLWSAGVDRARREHHLHLQHRLGRVLGDPGRRARQAGRGEVRCSRTGLMSCSG